MTVNGWVSMEVACCKCKILIIKDSPTRKYCGVCAHLKKIEQQKAFHEKIKPKKNNAKGTHVNKYYEKNKEHLIEYQRKYNAVHREQIRKYQTAWYAKRRKAMIEKEDSE